jgi:4,5-DOPA dioxygenase extradiol
MPAAPAVFFAHGSPMSALGGDEHALALRDFGEAVRPDAVIIVSAHWQKPMPVAVTSWETAPLLHDFAGFPDELYRIQYPVHGDGALAARVDLQLHAAGIPSMLDPGRGLDHGAWVPLRLAWPRADIPVLAVSLPPRPPRDLYAIGRALRPLREDNILIAGSGGIVHNLRRADIRRKEAPPEAWAETFDTWVGERIDAGDHEALFDYRKAPLANLSVPTPEHFDPIFIALGAAFDGERPRTIYKGFHYGTISMRSIVFES